MMRPSKGSNCCVEYRTKEQNQRDELGVYQNNPDDRKWCLELVMKVGGDNKIVI